jgi:hypothetical protein
VAHARHGASHDIVSGKNKNQVLVRGGSCAPRPTGTASLRSASWAGFSSREVQLWLRICPGTSGHQYHHTTTGNDGAQFFCGRPLAK